MEKRKKTANRNEYITVSVDLQFCQPFSRKADWRKWRFLDLDRPRMYIVNVVKGFCTYMFAFVWSLLLLRVFVLCIVQWYFIAKCCGKLCYKTITKFKPVLEVLNWSQVAFGPLSTKWCLVNASSGTFERGERVRGEMDVSCTNVVLTVFVVMVCGKGSLIVCVVTFC